MKQEILQLFIGGSKAVNYIVLLICAIIFIAFIRHVFAITYQGKTQPIYRKNRVLGIKTRYAKK